MPSGSQKPKVLHISGDFPDPIAPDKTPVIRTLIDLTTASFNHHVVSINRQKMGAMQLIGKAISGMGVPEIAADHQGFEYGTALAYRAPGRGILHKSMLEQLAAAIAQILADAQVQPDLIVAHKLTIEGLIVRELARQIDRPFALCIQGDTDTKIMAARLDLTGDFGRIFHEADFVFPFTKWAKDAVEHRLGKRAGPSALLPCPTDLDEPLAPKATGDGFVSVFHLKNAKRKNLRGIAEALQWLRANGNAPRVDIVGGGSSQVIEDCRQIALGLEEIAFSGPLDRPALRQRLNRASALVLPSHRESFGIVFIEALFSGTPIIYPKHMAVDGYFDGAPFALGVDALDHRAIAKAMAHVMAHEAEMKYALREWQGSGHAKQFQRSAIGDVFAKGLNAALLAG